MMDLVALVRDKPVLSIGGAVTAVGIILTGLLWVDARYANAEDVKTKIDAAAKGLKVEMDAAAKGLKVEMDKHAAEDKVMEQKQSVRDAWLSAGQAKTDATMARNRWNDCLIRPPKTPLEMTACEQYRSDMVDGNLRYQRAQEAAQKASRP